MSFLGQDGSTHGISKMLILVGGNQRNNNLRLPSICLAVIWLGIRKLWKLNFWRCTLYALNVCTFLVLQNFISQKDLISQIFSPPNFFPYCDDLYEKLYVSINNWLNQKMLKYKHSCWISVWAWWRVCAKNLPLLEEFYQDTPLLKLNYRGYRPCDITCLQTIPKGQTAPGSKCTLVYDKKPSNLVN